MRSKYAGGNRRSLSEEEEKEILAPFEKMAAEGHIVTAQDIRKVFDKKSAKIPGEDRLICSQKGTDGARLCPGPNIPRKQRKRQSKPQKIYNSASALARKI